MSRWQSEQQARRGRAWGAQGQPGRVGTWRLLGGDQAAGGSAEPSLGLVQAPRVDQAWLGGLLLRAPRGQGWSSACGPPGPHRPCPFPCMIGPLRGHLFTAPAGPSTWKAWPPVCIARPLGPQLPAPGPLCRGLATAHGLWPVCAHAHVCMRVRLADPRGVYSEAPCRPHLSCRPSSRAGRHLPFHSFLFLQDFLDNTFLGLF